MVANLGYTYDQNAKDPFYSKQCIFPSVCAYLQRDRLIDGDPVYRIWCKDRFGAAAGRVFCLAGSYCRAVYGAGNYIEKGIYQALWRVAIKQGRREDNSLAFFIGFVVCCYHYDVFGKAISRARW